MIYEFEGKNEKDAIEIAAAELGLEKDQFDVEILESQKNSLFKKGYVKIRVHTQEKERNDNSEFDGHIPHSERLLNLLVQLSKKWDILQQLISCLEKNIKLV